METTLSHSPYSIDLASLDYHLFDTTKEGLRDKHYTSDKEGKTAVMKWLNEQSTEFYVAGIHAIIQRWNIAIETIGDNVQK